MRDVTVPALHLETAQRKANRARLENEAEK
jgi:hypothetical protein